MCVCVCVCVFWMLSFCPCTIIQRSAECVAEKHSSAKKYISVTVGPVWVENGEQVGDGGGGYDWQVTPP